MEHAFNVKFAEKYGVDAAIFVKHLHFWILKNRSSGANFHDGHHWTYNTSKAYSMLFPYWSDQKVKRLLVVLEEEGLILSGNYNKTPMDRTKWYTITEKCERELGEIPEQSKKENETIEKSNLNNRKLKSEPPIPYINTDINTDVNTSIYSQKTQIDHIYDLYPTRCPISGRATGRSSSCKAKIRGLIKKHGADGVERVILTYIEDCKKTKTYFKNFSTLLNNFPDPEEMRALAEDERISGELSQAQIQKMLSIELED